MEEKERFELKIYAGCEYYSITDTKEKQQITIENTINLLNQQDKRIKELEEENQQLKQSQKQLAIEELKKLKENAWQSATDISQLIDYTELAKIIDNQIKELKGEK